LNWRSCYSVTCGQTVKHIRNYSITGLGIETSNNHYSEAQYFPINTFTGILLQFLQQIPSLSQQQESRRIPWSGRAWALGLGCRTSAWSKLKSLHKNHPLSIAGSNFSTMGVRAGAEWGLHPLWILKYNIFQRNF